MRGGKFRGWRGLKSGVGGFVFFKVFVLRRNSFFEFVEGLWVAGRV